MKRLKRAAPVSFPAFRHAVRWTATFFPTIFAGLTVAVHLVNPGLSWTKYTLSDLALGRFGWIESVSMFVFGLCLLGVVLGLRSCVRQSRPMRVATALLVLTALGFVATAVFRTSNSDIVTTGIVIHRVAVVTITVAFPVACFVMLPALRSDPQWRAMAVYCAVAGVVSVILDIIAVVVPHGVQQNLAGLWEKGSIANALIWCQAFASRVFLVGRGTSSASVPADSGPST
jgi:hypothetical membrane protein